MAKDKLTKAQQRVLATLSDGGCLWACFHEPDDFLRHGRLFVEETIIVHPPGGSVSGRYRVRRKTAEPLHLSEPALIDHESRDSGHRCFTLTEAGRAMLTAAGGK